MFAKKTLLLAMFMTVALPLQADPLTVYGKINVTAQNSDEGADSFSELKSNGSRFGIKGDYELDGELSLVYQLEWEVDITDEVNEKNIKGRDQFIGLKGSFGTIKAGRNDTALKLSQGKVDLFNDYEADLKTLWKGENRMSNSLAYVSPSFQGFSLLVSHIMEDTPEGKDGQSFALLYGDDGLKDSKLFASVGLDREVNGYDAVRMMGQVKVAGQLKVGAGLMQQEAVSNGTKEDGWLANLSYPLDKYELKAQYQTLEEHKRFSFGTDYKIGKDTKLFAWYSSFDFDNKVDTDYVAIGIEHKF